MTSIEKSFAYVDRFIKQSVRKSAAQGGPVTCHLGCFHCCKEPVQALREEAQHLVDSLTDPAHRDRVTEKTRIWWDNFLASGLDQMPMPRKGTGFDYILNYRAENLWCPILEKGLCSLYAGRPTSCRFHNAIGAPRKCRVDTERPSQIYMSTQEQAQVEANAVSLLADGASRYLYQVDYLGVWLGHILLGKTERSAAGHDFIAEFAEAGV